MPTAAPTDQHARLEAATAGLDAPLLAVDLAAFDANADTVVALAGGTPVRVASKSLRCRPLLRRVLDRPGFAGVLAFTLAEALWLARDCPDVVVGYPTADRTAIAALATSQALAARVTLMVDDLAQLDLVDAVAPPGRRPELRVCLDLDASLRAAGLHLGPRRSPVHSPADAAALARAVVARPGVRLVGLMAYEGQIAGTPDRPRGRPWQQPAIRGLKAWSAAELARRRAAAVAAVREVADLEFVNGGGTGSLATTAAEPAVTELAAGSAFYAPALFDGYRGLALRPAAFFAVAVVRRPGPGLVTVAGGGWPASGAAGADRLPVPTYPAGLRLLGLEGAGEVQTPLRGAAADRLAVGDRVWFRHAKAGEPGERLDRLHLVGPAGELAGVVPTYRGEGRSSG